MVQSAAVIAVVLAACLHQVTCGALPNAGSHHEGALVFRRLQYAGPQCEPGNAFCDPKHTTTLPPDPEFTTTLFLSSLQKILKMPPKFKNNDEKKKAIIWGSMIAGSSAVVAGAAGAVIGVLTGHGTRSTVNQSTPSASTLQSTTPAPAYGVAAKIVSAPLAPQPSSTRSFASANMSGTSQRIAAAQTPGVAAFQNHKVTVTGTLPAQTTTPQVPWYGNWWHTLGYGMVVFVVLLLCLGALLVCQAQRKSGAKNRASKRAVSSERVSRVSQEDSDAEPEELEAQFEPEGFFAAGGRVSQDIVQTPSDGPQAVHVQPYATSPNWYTSQAVPLFPSDAYMS